MSDETNDSADQQTHSSADDRSPLNPTISALLVLLALTAAALLLFWPRARVVTPSPLIAGTATPPVAPSTTPATPTASMPGATPTAVTPPAPPADEKLETGLTLTVVRAGGASDKRSARLIALYVGEHDAPTPFMDPGPFTATWEGYLIQDVWNNVTFSAEGAGAFTLTINGKPVLDLAGPALAGKGVQIRLEKGKNRVVATYRSPAKGDAVARLLWASSEYPAEPVPPTVFSHNLNDKELKTALKLRHGRELVGSMRCTKCHASDAKAESGLPELAIDAPDLRDAGARLNAEWMAAWIKDPKALRANATMPRLLHGKDTADLGQQAADLAAYLATLGKPEADPASDDKMVATGGYQFAKLGCVACHAANSDGPAYIDLTHLKAKWKPAALVAFLQQPTKHYAWIRMPTFGFSVDQARQLAAFLLSRDQVEAPKALAGDATRGKALAAANGCMNCHQLGEGNQFKAPAFSAIGEKRAAGCLATDDADRHAAPDFALEGSDVSALRAFLATDLVSLKRRSLPEFAERRIAALRCAACHERDGNDALLTAYSGEIDKLTGEFPAPEENEAGEGGAAAGNPCPLLTFTGDKLRPEWMGQFIAGKISYRPRPWLSKHMPSFPAAAELLAQGLALEHGHPALTPADAVLANAPAASVGKDLTGQTGGFACISCHAIGSQEPVAVFEAPGINLGYAAQRLQKDYFHRWMRMPTRFDATTRMPKFAADDGTTPLKNILDGKADDQFEAVWQFLVEVNKQADFPH